MLPNLSASRALARLMSSGIALLALCLMLIVALAAPERAFADRDASASVGPRLPGSVVRELAAGAPVFEICRDQTYALCAVASCYVYNQVAYCKCDIESGDSISLPFEADGENVCDVNAQGPTNGYLISTFSLADSVVKGGDMALYTCPGGRSDGAYAQCDGGFCFTSTEGAPAFPGFDQPLTEGEIICSCPITIADPDTANLGYQIAGPFPCEADYFENCKSAASNARTGSTIPVGAPTGVARILTLLLDGRPVPPLNRCPSPGGRG
jgi:hypothetical protein